MPEASAICLLLYQPQTCQPATPTATAIITVVTRVPYCSHQALIWEICSCSSRLYAAIFVLVFSEQVVGYRICERSQRNTLLYARPAQRLDIDFVSRRFVVSDNDCNRRTRSIGPFHL